MKFGKQIQKRQLEVPEYAASFVNYKALKKVRVCVLLVASCVVDGDGLPTAGKARLRVSACLCV
jgi:hypothetical protein